jgi:hypothetical protein
MTVLNLECDLSSFVRAVVAAATAKPYRYTCRRRFSHVPAVPPAPLGDVCGVYEEVSSLS